MQNESSSQCPVRERLEGLVQHHLKELSSLASEEIVIIKSGNRELILEVDQRIENTIGEKERALGALNEHRTEHGC